MGMDATMQVMVNAFLRKLGAPAIVGRFISDAKWKFGGCIRDVRCPGGERGITYTQRFTFDGAEGDVTLTVPNSLVSPDMMAFIARAEDAEAKAAYERGRQTAGSVPLDKQMRDHLLYGDGGTR